MGESFPNPAVRNSKPPALLVRGPKPYPKIVKAIKERIDSKDFGNNVHFNKPRKLLIRFTNNKTIEEELKRMRDKLSDMGPEVIRNMITLGRLDRILILDIDPSTAGVEILEVLKAIAPEKLKETIRINGLWQTSSGYAKALFSVFRGVFYAMRRIRVGFFLCRVQLSALPPLDTLSVTTSPPMGPILS